MKMLLGFATLILKEAGKSLILVLFIAFILYPATNAPRVNIDFYSAESVLAGISLRTIYFVSWILPGGGIIAEISSFTEYAERAQVRVYTDSNSSL